MVNFVLVICMLPGCRTVANVEYICFLQIQMVYWDCSNNAKLQYN